MTTDALVEDIKRVSGSMYRSTLAVNSLKKSPFNDAQGHLQGRWVKRGRIGDTRDKLFVVLMRETPIYIFSSHTGKWYGTKRIVAAIETLRQDDPAWAELDIEPCEAQEIAALFRHGALGLIMHRLGANPATPT